MTHTTKIATIVILLSVISAEVSAGERVPAPPNVILLMTDDQGYGDLSCHGNPVIKTPNMDRLHAESVRFTDFHVAPMCSPTRGQLMTGLDAMRNGATAVCQGRSMMRADIPTMADFFAGSGYATGHSREVPRATRGREGAIGHGFSRRARPSSVQRHLPRGRPIV